MALQLLLATPFASNTFRVFFNKQPRTFSPLSDDDVLNRLNWTISVSSGPGSSPVVCAVEEARAQPDWNVSYPNAWSVDLRVDRRILANSIYLVVGSTAIESADGLDSLGANPNDRDSCPGDMTARGRKRVTPDSVQPRLDYNYDTFTGLFVVDSKGDISTHGELASLKKRILRRLMSSPKGFYHLDDYGVGLKTKEKFDSTSLAKIRADAMRQILLEDEVAKVAVDVTASAGVLFLRIRVETRSSEKFSMGVEVPEDGLFIAA